MPLICLCLSVTSEKELEKVLAAYAEHSHSSAVLFGEKPKPHIPKSGKHLLSRHSHLSRVLQRQSRVSRSRSPHPSARQDDDFSVHMTSNGSRTFNGGYGEKLEALTSSSPPYDFKKYSDETLKTGSWASTHSMQGRCTGAGAKKEVGKEGLHPQSTERWARDGAREEGGVRKKMGREGIPLQSPERLARGGSGVREGSSGRRLRGQRLLQRTLSNQSLHSVTSGTFTVIAF